MDMTNIVNFFKKNSATILSGVGIGTLVATTAYTVPVTAKVTRKIVAEEQQLGRPLTFKEKFKLSWKNYIPVAIGTIGGSTSAILGQKQAQQTAAAFAAELTKETIKLADYQKKVEETVGSETAEKIRNDISKDKLEKTFGPADSYETFVVASDVKVKYVDNYSGRVFYATPNQIDDIVNKVNKHMLDEDYISLNEVYDIINDETSSKLEWTMVGGMLGFRISDGLLTKSQMHSEMHNGYPVAIFTFDREPVQEFDSI